MSNKTSDKNVANVTKSDIDILKALINVYETGLPNCDELLYSEVKALKNVLSEREQDKKRIQELEEENERKDKFIKMAKEVIDNSILKQVVIDKIDELKLSGGSDGKDNVENLVRELTIDILQELLEGERK